MSFTYSSTPQAIWLYQYDADGAFIGSVFMHVPANTGLPVNTTSIPCEPASGMTGVFNGESWQYVNDIRGVQYWNEYGQGFVISSLQESLPDWAICIEPPESVSGYALFFTDGQWKYIEDVRGTKYWNNHGQGFVIYNLHESLPDWAISIEPPAPVPGYAVLFTEGQWEQVEDKTGQFFYNNNGIKHIVPDAYFTLPDGYTFVTPPDAKPSFVTQWNGSEWGYVEDLRGEIAFSTKTKESYPITEVGPLQDGYTLLMPSLFDEWDGDAWVKNEDAERAYNIDQAERKKAKLLAIASEQIAVLAYAIDKSMATDNEKDKLAQWEEYRLVVNRVDTTDTDITWPEKP